MRPCKSLVLAAASLAVLASPALAQNLYASDFTSQTPYAAAPTADPGLARIPQITNWAGFHLGLNTGVALSSPETRFGDALTDPTLSGAYPFMIGVDRSAFLAGGQIGYSYQWGRYVLGAEADFQYLPRSSSDGEAATTFTNASGSGASRTTAWESLNYLSTLRMSYGYAYNNVLPYVTGGLAFGRANAKTTLSATGLDTSSNPVTWSSIGSGDANRFGYALGAGVEYSLTNNLSVRGEYLHYDLGSITYNAGSTNARTSFNGDLFRIGLNFRM